MRHSNMIKRILPVLCMVVLWTGCDSFLEPDPASFSTTANFYETPTQMEQAVNGVYARLRGFMGDEDYRYMTDLRGPTLTRHFDVNLPHTVAGIPQLDEFTMDVANGVVERNWQRMYQTIKEANVVIGRIDAVEFPDAAQKDRIIGEAKFIRALCYWNGVQFWGDIPLSLEEITSPSQAVPEGGRRPASEVYTQIVTDLQDAIAKLPVSYSGANVGRATQGAARFLLGKTYLLTGNFTGAATEFTALDAGPYSYSMMPTYLSVFDPANKNNAESIFELQFNPNIAGQPQIDALLVDILPYTAGGVFAIPTVVPLGRYMPTPDVINAYEPGDLRYADAIGWWEAAGNSAYPEIAFNDSIPYLNKFYWPAAINGQGQMNVNWISFRFADALLSAAEAYWRSSNDGQAMTYLNRVRDRAGLPPVNLGDFSGATTGSPMGDAILHERMIELLGEGHYWLDLMRFGSDVAERVMVAHGQAFRARDSKTLDVYNIRPDRFLYMVPPREILLGELTQNPGWN
ncbi:MAG: RagB/SusD family nutrient uptake outer membrane protein [Rhodothermales bacterium]